MEDYSLSKFEIDNKLLSFYSDDGQNSLSINKENRNSENDMYLSRLSAKNNLSSNGVLGTIRSSLSSALEKYYGEK